MWRGTIEPAIKAWVKQHKLDFEDGDQDFLKEISRFLKFVLRESKAREPAQTKRVYVKSGRYKGQKSHGNRAPDVKYIDDPQNPRFVDITPETILVNRGHKLWSILQLFRGEPTRIRLFLTVLVRSTPILRDREKQTRTHLESLREYWADLDKDLALVWNKALRL